MNIDNFRLDNPNTDLYNILDVNVVADTETIKNKYLEKISEYNNVQELSDVDIYHIKTLKIALMVLSDETLRMKYNKFKTLNDSKINFERPTNIKNRKSDRHTDIQVEEEFENDLLDQAYDGIGSSLDDMFGGSTINMDELDEDELYMLDRNFNYTT